MKLKESEKKMEKKLRSQKLLKEQAVNKLAEVMSHKLKNKVR